MLNSIHFLTTYTCNFECEHCFLYSRPGAGGTFTLAQICSALDEIVKTGIIKAVCFEGGEPFLYFPLVLEAIDQARARGLSAGVVTNAYWATSEEDAQLWLRPLFARGVTSVSISDDALHYGDAPGVHGARVAAAAARIGMASKVLCTQRPTVQVKTDEQGRPQQVVSGGVMFRGRAAEKLTAGLPTRQWDSLTRCPHEDLRSPKRVHADCFGHLHLCQGLSMGNFWDRPLSKVVAEYDGDAHPVAGPLLRGGPAELARQYRLPHEQAYVDECHFCFMMRLALRDRFPQYLGPPLVYGLK
jgi:hypothetical protein